MEVRAQKAHTRLPMRVKLWDLCASDEHTWSKTQIQSCFEQPTAQAIPLQYHIFDDHKVEKIQDKVRKKSTFQYFEDLYLNNTYCKINVQ